MMSGTAVANWSFASDPVTKGEYFLRELNCSTVNSSATIECLQAIADWRIIRDVKMSPQFASDFSPIWGPVLDGILLDSDPLQMMSMGEYMNYEVP